MAVASSLAFIVGCAATNQTPPAAQNTPGTLGRPNEGTRMPREDPAVGILAPGPHQVNVDLNDPPESHQIVVTVVKHKDDQNSDMARGLKSKRHAKVTITIHRDPLLKPHIWVEVGPRDEGAD